MAGNSALNAPGLAVACDYCDKPILPGEERMVLPAENGQVTMCIPCVEHVFHKVMSEDQAH